MNEKDAYKLLNIPYEKNHSFLLNLTDSQFKKMYYKYCLKTHPDKCNNNSVSEFQDMQNAFEILSELREKKKNIDSYENIEFKPSNSFKEYLYQLFFLIHFPKDEIDKITDIIYNLLILNCNSFNSKDYINFLERIDTVYLNQIIEILLEFKNNSTIKLNEFIEIIENIVNKNVKHLILNPTLEELLNYGIYIYKINESKLVYIPVWIPNYTYSFGNISINTEIIFPKGKINNLNYEFDEKYNLIISLQIKLKDIIMQNGFTIDLINRDLFISNNYIKAKEYQQITIPNQGIPLYKNDPYEINLFSDILINLNLI